MIATRVIAGAAPLLGFVQLEMTVMSRDAWRWWTHQGNTGPILSCRAWITVVTVLLGCSLAVTALRKGQRARWGWMALTSLAGVAVVYGLPDRTNRPPRGFPIEPNVEQ